MSDGNLVIRKNDHLDIVLDSRRTPVPTGDQFARYQFEHCALPELHLDAIDLSARFLGRTLQAPLLISSMTGGAARAKYINHHLAEAAQALGIALAIGSQRVAVESGIDHGLTGELRTLAPDVPLLANIGAAQLADGSTMDWARRAVDMIGADALIIHLNPLQEAVQGGGDRDWRRVLDAIGALVQRCQVPVVVKEVGAGISASVAQSLVEVGVSVIDVAGAGGTSWALVEAERAASEADRQVAMAFVDWGIPTTQAIVQARRALPTTPLIASGGIRNGVDAAKAIRLGADLVGQAAAVLQSATQSTEAVIAHFDVLVRQLRIACFCTGSANLAALRRAPLHLDGVRLE
ncbi:isopentenyl-diphosphate delta-isomerase [Pseudomonas saudimassiliensis]|uniref:Isopentenyl-diphosphate delta-isomerase n=1 Tax=Pseudomonas saudimassiliensis TaxID=1461581 RepID=A0A078MC15_9PSED|nr:type 2 isopentenyl-diphosphate Delta-isomerase [Pseudomonas saudimassiliensis]CEA03734.1 isopentenyl-diphosphate delta-isomerase [Pseudomonas saudimassiliensis]CEF26288.1 isopentenyl-diphosphate delta-isomerase [Pseudomonas saudimassiliensis]